MTYKKTFTFIYIYMYICYNSNKNPQIMGAVGAYKIVQNSNKNKVYLKINNLGITVLLH